MKTNWSLLGMAILGGAAVSLLLFVLATYQYGNQPTAHDMAFAAELGGGVGGVLILVSAGRRSKKPPPR